ncbi:MAG: FkbM family methyltransferase [Bacteroidota bacterium]
MKKFVNSLLAPLGLRITGTVPTKNEQRRNAFLAKQKLLADEPKPLTILDVGAYHGEVALQYNKWFPDSKIYCFEPLPASFNKLAEVVAEYPRISPIQKGVGARSGIGHLNVNAFAATNSLLNTHAEGYRYWGSELLDTKEVIGVEITTIDEFVTDHKITCLDLLKMDVQGAEYLVLKGARNSIDRGLVKVIYAELMTLPAYEEQRSIDEMLALYRSLGFTLFGLYNFSYSPSDQLRNMDLIMVWEPWFRSRVEDLK